MSINCQKRQLQQLSARDEVAHQAKFRVIEHQFFVADPGEQRFVRPLGEAIPLARIFYEFCREYSGTSA
jgi:hypothetical protein